MSDEKPVSAAKPKPEANSQISDEVWDSAVSEWVNACVRGSPISHDVGAWNRLNEVLPRLRDLLNNALIRASAEE